MEKIKRIILRKKEPEWMNTDMILSQFGGRDGHKAYREKVQNYAEEEGRLWEDFRHGVILGSAGFVESIRSLKGEKSPGYLVVEAELPPGVPPGRELRARRTAHPIFALTVLQSECIISAMWIESRRQRRSSLLSCSQVRGRQGRQASSADSFRRLTT